MLCAVITGAIDSGVAVIDGHTQRAAANTHAVAGNNERRTENDEYT